MTLTPLDIRKQEFARSFRGLDPDEVTSFLQMVSNQWEELLADQRKLEQKVRDAEAKLDHYLKVEEALQEALRTARESARQALENAQHQANQLLREAERRADEIKRTAEQDRLSLRREADEMRSRRHEIVARLRAFLHSELELLGRFEADAHAGVGASQQALSESTHGPNDYRHEQGRGGMVGEPSDSTPAHSVHREDGRGTGWVVRPVISAPPTPWPEEAEEPVEEQSLTEEPAAVDPSPATSPAEEAPTAAQEPQPDHPNAEAHENKEETYNLAASEDEIERIRRILEDLE